MITCPKCGVECDNNARFCGSCGENLAAVMSKDAKTDPYIGLKLEDKYLVLETIGDGGMGKVYAAEQLNLQKPVAIKIIHRNLIQRDDQVQRFKREAFSASRLNHPHSIQILDFGQAPDEAHFIVMEKLEGEELSAVIARDFPLSPERIVHILTQVLSVLHDAHQNKIIHRDLKPENIMLIKRAEEVDYVKVLDFGIAKLTEPDPEMPALTMAGIVCGTPEYMSPEQARGKDLDSRTDIYSAGCILYEMLTGQVPFLANNYQAILGMHIREQPVRPSQLRPDLDIPPKLEEIALNAMQKDREFRFPDALAMKTALEVCLHETDPQASTPSRRAVNRSGQTHVSAKTPPESLFPPPSPVPHATMMGPGAEQTNGNISRGVTPPSVPDLDELDDAIEIIDEPAAAKSRMPMMVGGAILVLLVLAGVAYALMGDKMPEDNEDGDTRKIVIADPTGNGTAPDPVKPVDDKPTDGDSAQNAGQPGDPAGQAVAAKPDGDAEAEKAETTAKVDEEAPKPAATKPKPDPKPKALSAVEKKKKALEYYEKGNDAFSAGKLSSAIRFYTLAKRYNPSSPSVYKKLGLAYMKKGDATKAKKNFGRYLRLAPKASDAARIRELYNSL